MVDTLISYIRSFFPTETRKRRAAPSFDDMIIRNPKVRRMGSLDEPGAHEDDWRSLSSGNSNNSRRSFLNSAKARSPLSKENIIHIDEDDVEFIKPPSKHTSPLITLSNSNGIGQYTSTPNDRNGLNGDDNDVTFIKCTPRDDSKFAFRRREATKPYSYLAASQERSKKADSDLTFSSIRSRYSSRYPFARSSLLDQSVQLDEKQKYKELLAKMAPISTVKPTSTFSLFSKYNTPTGRGKKLLTLASQKEPKRPTFIDLTNGTAKSAQATSSTGDAIKKAIEDFDKEHVTVRDSDSDVEILPTPPSPKSDIQVERVNTLKKEVEQSERFQRDWLPNLINKFKNATEERHKHIMEQKLQKQKLGEINSEVRSKMLEEQLQKCLKIRDAVLPVIEEKEAALRPLTDAEEQQVSQAINRRANPNEVLISKFSIDIKRRDMLTLDGLNWLNDEIINFYMNLIMQRGKKPQWPAAYAMNTFFYPKLKDQGYDSLKRWTKKVDVFAHDFIAVPIHLGVHWCMAVINLKEKTIRYYDSMGSPNERCLQLLLDYLSDEHLDKKKADFDTTGWKLESVRDIPQQMNGSDCGMFSCTFAEFLTRNEKITFSQQDMPYLRRKMVLEILKGELLIT